MSHRYDVIIQFKGAHSSCVLPFKSLHQVNTWLKDCIDDTVKETDVRDNVLRSILTYKGQPMLKKDFVANGIPREKKRKNLARYL